jgi:hypothetical protein
VDASQLVDEIVEALKSHPDEFWAKRAAVERICEWMGGKHVDCPYCGGEFSLLEDD